ncbi:MAG: hypothetical protein ABEJ31_13615 [Haloarculaceae archaeon]
MPNLGAGPPDGKPVPRHVRCREPLAVNLATGVAVGATVEQRLVDRGYGEQTATGGK